jgi:hypothetical protein
MTIDNLGVVDRIDWNSETDEVALIIIDHLSWTGDDQSNKEHMYFLQEKVNTYLEFIESGEIYQSCPKARAREIVILVMAMDPLSQEAEAFFEKVKAFVLKAGHKMRFWHMS